MRILIVTPHFPPDTTPSANYVGELAERLASTHQITILLFGDTSVIVPGVKIITINQHRPVLFRTWSFMVRLRSQAILNDLVLIQNGPAIEMPIYFTLSQTKTSLIMLESDQASLDQTNQHPRWREIHRRLKKIALTLTTTDTTWPDNQSRQIAEGASNKNDRWEESWQEHLNDLQKLFPKMPA